MNIFSLFENAVAAWGTGRPCAAVSGGRATVSSMRLLRPFAGHLASLEGYWRNEAANAASFARGWLRTGDIGYFDGRGRLHVLDRRQGRD
jgi:acyl-coenzyme A synthetase/AMP-(fatty) acid ligase